VPYLISEKVFMLGPKKGKGKKKAKEGGEKLECVICKQHWPKENFRDHSWLSHPQRSTLKEHFDGLKQGISCTRGRVGFIDPPGGPQGRGTGGSLVGLREYRPRKAWFPGGTGCRDRKGRERAERAMPYPLGELGGSQRAIGCNFEAGSCFRTPSGNHARGCMRP
jgi:hypothetical protein